MQGEEQESMVKSVKHGTKSRNEKFKSILWMNTVFAEQMHWNPDQEWTEEGKVENKEMKSANIRHLRVH